MRLDLFLKASRVCARRAAAQELCEASAVWVNGVPAKSSRAVHVGDEISLLQRNRHRAIRVLAVPTIRQTSRSEAATLYEVLSDTTLNHAP